MGNGLNRSFVREIAESNNDKVEYIIRKITEMTQIPETKDIIVYVGSRRIPMKESKSVLESNGNRIEMTTTIPSESKNNTLFFVTLESFSPNGESLGQIKYSFENGNAKVWLVHGPMYLSEIIGAIETIVNNPTAESLSKVLSQKPGESNRITE